MNAELIAENQKLTQALNDQSQAYVSLLNLHQHGGPPETVPLPSTTQTHLQNTHTAPAHTFPISLRFPLPPPFAPAPYATRTASGFKIIRVQTSLNSDWPGFSKLKKARTELGLGKGKGKHIGMGAQSRNRRQGRRRRHEKQQTQA